MRTVLKKGLDAMLRIVAGKLPRITTLSASKKTREGHFVVVAVEGKEPKRFQIRLVHLCNPDFLNLLKQAEEEFGFPREGAIELPCQPDELQRILSVV